MKTIQSKYGVPEFEAIACLKRHGIPYPSHGLARSAEEAVEISRTIGFPVVMKIASAGIVHKSEVGGVIADLHSSDAVLQAYDTLLHRVRAASPQAAIAGVLVCQQAARGLEVIIGSTQDKAFGPTLMFGLGGIYVEIFKDVSFRVLPLTPIDAQEMIREINGFPLLDGARGQDGLDVAQLEDLILSVSRMLTRDPGIVELDLNPVRLYAQGLMVLDIHMVRGDACS